MREKREATDCRNEVGRRLTRLKKLPLIVASEAQLENLKERMQASVLYVWTGARGASVGCLGLSSVGNSVGERFVRY
jgi:hypothetical protein